jgi:phage shock protein E
MKTRPLVLALAALVATGVFAQNPEPKKPAAPAPAPDPAATGVRDVTPADVEKLLAARKDLVILDVRTPEEFQMGHLAGAKNMSFLDLDFAQNLSEIEGKPVILHCATGNRSFKALSVLKTKNFPTIYHLTGGYKAWIDAGKPVVGSPSVK